MWNIFPMVKQNFLWHNFGPGTPPSGAIDQNVRTKFAKMAKTIHRAGQRHARSCCRCMSVGLCCSDPAASCCCWLWAAQRRLPWLTRSSAEGASFQLYINDEITRRSWPFLMLIVAWSDNVRRRFAQYENFGPERLTYYLVSFASRITMLPLCYRFVTWKDRWWLVTPSVN